MVQVLVIVTTRGGSEMTGQKQSTKHMALRTCVVCRQKTDKRQLKRLVYTMSGLVIDATGKATGRGAYLCQNPDCWKRAHKSAILDRALRMSLTSEDKRVLLEHET